MKRIRRIVSLSLIHLLVWPLAIIHRIALRLDDWFYPAWKNVSVTRPLFIVGLPRSGTTMFHRLIASDKATFTTFELWELLFAPAICQKRLFLRISQIDAWFGRPLQRCLSFVQSKFAGSLDHIHATKLDSPEEDYLSLLPFGGCFLKVLMSPHDMNVWRLGHFSDQMSEREKTHLLDIYEGMLKRHLYFRGTDRCLLSKNPSFTSWVPDLAERFADARFVGLRRNPEQAVPSQLSSIRSAMASFGNDAADPVTVDRFVGLLSKYWQILDSAARTLPRERFRLVKYDKLISDSFHEVTKSLNQLGYEVSSQQRELFAEQCNQQRRYQSRHKYSLEEFGLDSQALVEKFPYDAQSCTPGNIEDEFSGGTTRDLSAQPVLLKGNQ